MIYLGTAGWSYPHWRGTFYPRNVENELEYYSNHSLLNEINTTFYRIPSETMVQRWYRRTPANFIFSAKLIREVTHVSRPIFKPEKMRQFFVQMQGLEEKFKVLLIQFPPSFRNTSDTRSFLIQVLDKCSKHFTGQIVLEIRNKSWFTEDIRDLIYEKRIVLAETTTLSISGEYHNKNVPNYYIRLLGDRRIIPDNKLGKFFLEKSEERQTWAQKIIQLSSMYETIFVLINNRFSGYAINDAIALRKILAKKSIPTQGFENSEKYINRQMTLGEFL